MKSKGFTFLETLVVIGIFSLIFPLVLSILFVIMQQQLRVFSLTEVKRQGDYIVNFLETTIANNAYKMYDTGPSDPSPHEVCEAGSVNSYPHEGSPITFKDKFNNEFSLIYSEPDLTITYPPSLDPAPPFTFPQGLLNNSKVRIANFSVACTKLAPYSAPLVKIDFTICYNNGGSCDGGDTQRTVSLDYQSTIKLRTFPTEEEQIP